MNPSQPDPLIVTEHLQTPRAVRRVARALTVLLVALPFALLFVPWQQNARGEGQVVAYAPLDRQQTVEAPIDGRIVRWWVIEGSPVNQGDPLFEITDNDPQFLERIEGQLQAKREKLSALTAKIRSYDEQVGAFTEARDYAKEAARERVEMARHRLTAKQRGVDAASIEWETARLNFERREALREDGLASGRDWELARLGVRRTEAERDAAKADLEGARNDLKAMEAELDRIDADFAARITSAQASRESAVSEAASTRALILELEVRRARQQTQRVTAPVAGTILRLMANQGGEMVKGGEPVVRLIPHTEQMAVELWIDGNDLPLLSQGRSVRLQFEGWPAVQFAGWPSVAVGTFGGRISLIDAADDGQGRFRILVTPDPDDEPWPSRRYLRQGVRARGWVLLEQVTMGFELWRQLNGFPPVIADAEPLPAPGKE